jgi:integrase
VRRKFPDSFQPFFTVIYRTGMRRGELLNLRWRQVDFKNRWIELKYGETKTGEGRYVPFLVDMEEWLTRQWELRRAELPGSEYVFFWHRTDLKKPIPVIRYGRNRGVEGVMTVSASHRISKRDLVWVWDAAVKSAGFPKLLIHDMRRSALRNMVQEYGIGTTEAMLISGHKSFEVFRRYNIQTTKTLRMTAEAINARHATMCAVAGMMGSSSGTPVSELERLLREGSIEEIMEHRRRLKAG